MFTIDRNIQLNEDAGKLSDLITLASKNNSTYNLLESYYTGKHPILDRTYTSKVLTDAGNVMINHAELITDTNLGYFMGNPVEYKYDESKINLEPLIDAYKVREMDVLDHSLGFHASLFGHAYEYIYVDEDSKIRSARLDPRNTVVLHDTTVAHKKLWGIYFYNEGDVSGETDTMNKAKTPTSKDGKHRVILCNDKYVYTGTLTNASFSLDNAGKAHGLGYVPMIEYKNSDYATGDFEAIISLIDAYNILQSDRLHDKAEFTDAILAVYGATLSDEQIAQLKEMRVIQGIDIKSKLEYVVKNIDEEKMDVLRKTIEDDIFKIAKTPNFTDRNFIGNSTGVALRYKLLSFEQKAQIKEMLFSAGLRERLLIYCNFMKLTAKGKVSNSLSKLLKGPKDKNSIKTYVDLVFTRSLPRNDYETSQMLANLRGQISDKTAVSQLSYVTDPQREVAEARKDYPQTDMMTLLDNNAINDPDKPEANRNPDDSETPEEK